MKRVERYFWIKKKAGFEEVSRKKFLLLERGRHLVLWSVGDEIIILGSGFIKIDTLKTIINML